MEPKIRDVSKVQFSFRFSAAVQGSYRKTHSLFSGICSILLLVQGVVFAADQVIVQLHQNAGHAELDWHANLQLPVSATFPSYSVLQSFDLSSWEPVGAPVNGSVGVSDEALRLALPLTSDHAFYRVVATFQPAGDGNFGDAIFGYSTRFSLELQRLGQLSLDNFVTRYAPTNQYLPSIQFDPTTAQFWDQFNIDPAVYNATNPTDPRITDFRLTTNEFAVFQTNGFVVLPRLGSYSFADSFYSVYSAKLPVFVSTDAILQAWHRSYTAMLEEIEETLLWLKLQSLVQGMAAQVPGLWAQTQGTALENGVRDADLFLAVAQSLITGTNNYGNLGQPDQITAINTILTGITNLQPAYVTLFGSDRLVDFSQFQVRGHYTTSQRLAHYFQAMMWCELVDFRLIGSTNANSLRELCGAVTMNQLMSRAGAFNNWQQFDDIVQMFVGAPDSMNFAQLSDLLIASGMSWPGDYTTNGLQTLQERLLSGQLGVQNIRSGYFFSPLSREQIKLPRSFTVLGQRFIVDGWVHSQVVFDSIIWDDDGIPGFEDKVVRRVPSALDVAFSVFANNQVVPEIAGRISQTNLTLADGRVFFRDGLKYQHNLAAVRNVIDSQTPEAWTNNIYSSWLGCLRELSAPTTDPLYPQAMRTPAWAMRTLNTQLASWTELRHDTVLYAKQPYTGLILCGYPDGYVEPRPTFWLRMKEMALSTEALVSTLPNVNWPFVFEPNDGYDQPFTNTYAAMWTNRVQMLDFFATTMSTLQAISESELAGIPLTPDQVLFLKGIVENPGTAYTGAKTYSGWYPALFFKNSRAAHSTAFSCDRWDALVTDVHTDPPEPLVSDPGSILHEAVGNVHLLMIAVDCADGDAAVYAGPVLSHYEFELGPTTRQTDDEWKSNVRAGNLPPQPDWTRSYLVPGSYIVPSGVN